MNKLFDAPLIKKITIPSKSRTISADLYSPKDTAKHFPLLLVHGAISTGKDEEQLVLLAKDLARAGFLVLVPDFEGIKAFRVRIPDAEEILQSFRTMNSQPQATQHGGGMLGFNYGSGPMLLAAADARIRDKVRVVATFGAYYDLRNVALFGTTGAFEYAGQRGLIRPDTAIRWMLAYRNRELLRMSADQQQLKKIIEKRNQYEIVAADALAKALHAEGKALYALLQNNDPERFHPLYENLPLSLREYVYQLSPSRAIKFIPAHFIIVHATDDYVVPYTESIRIADAVGDLGRAHLALLPQFMHGEPIDPSIGSWYKRYGVGGWRLFFALYDLLGKAE